MKLTLLQIVQSVLSAMEADNINSISDTVESVAISRVAEEVYYELLSRSDWPHLEQVTKLIGASDSETPTTLVVPVDVKYIKAFWYNGKELTYKTPEEFIRLLNERSNDLTAITPATLPNGVTLPVLTNKAPQFFTVFNNNYIITDSLDITEGLTLHSSRAYATVSIIPEFSSLDSFVPDLETTMFPTYLSMVKRAAFLYLRRESSPHDERAATAGMGRLMQDKQKLYRLESKIHYGRK